MEFAVERGARVVNVRNAPVRTPSGWRSPADPMFDPIWARAHEAGIVVAAHAGDSGYGVLADRWEPGGDLEAFRMSPLRAVVSRQRDIHDFCAALICHGLFDRFPKLKIASIESGAGWVKPLKSALKKVHAQNPGFFSKDPVETFDEHFWVTPFWEDDVDGVVASMAPDRILFGSDWPHAEGTATPLDYTASIAHLDESLQRRIMRENAFAATGVATSPASGAC